MKQTNEELMFQNPFNTVTDEVLQNMQKDVTGFKNNHSENIKNFTKKF
jgi:hypothetical protein